jgi:hypothetical protein
MLTLARLPAQTCADQQAGVFMDIFNLSQSVFTTCFNPNVDVRAATDTPWTNTRNIRHFKLEIHFHICSER